MELEKKEVIDLIGKIEKQKAIAKIGYWQTVGNTLLAKDGVGEKWCTFVEDQAYNDFIKGALLDETLQIISMIKSNVSYEVIAQTINEIPGGLTIIDTYLPAFIHPEILYNIKSFNHSKKI